MMIAGGKQTATCESYTSRLRVVHHEHAPCYPRPPFPPHGMVIARKNLESVMQNLKNGIQTKRNSDSFLPWDSSWAGTRAPGETSTRNLYELSKEKATKERG